MTSNHGIPASGLATACAGAILGATPISGAPIDGASYNVTPLRAVMNDDVRVLWFGDSFAVGATWRVSGASMVSWPISADFVAASSGEIGQNALMRTTALSDPLTRIFDGNGYRLFDSGPEASLGLRFALPTWRAREFYAPAGDSEPLDLVQYTTRTLFAGGTIPGFLEANAPLRVRPLYLQTVAGVPVLARTYESAVDSLTIDPGSSPTPEGMPGEAGDFRVMTNGSRIASFTMSIPPHAERGYFQSPGLVFYETDETGARQEGIYWSYLADNSWTYNGFGRDEASGAGTPTKTFSRDQLVHWLDATAIDREQPNFVFYYFDAEDIDPEVAEFNIRAMVEQTEAAALQAGIGPVHHTFVVPHSHTIGSGSDRREDPALFVRRRDTAVAVAQTRDDMSVLSIFDATDGVLLDGSAEARAWLAANGHDAFTAGDRTFNFLSASVGGDLLDTFRVHPDTGTPAASLFAWYAGRAITDVCPADFSAPYGQLDLADINAFVAAFVAGSYAVDLAEPYGVIDLDDLSLFTGSFVDGCDPTR